MSFNATQSNGFHQIMAGVGGDQNEDGVLAELSELFPSQTQGQFHLADAPNHFMQPKCEEIAFQTQFPTELLH